jgi:CBS domain-containing protein
VYDYVAGRVDWLAAGLPSEGRDAAKPTAKDVARHDTPTCGLDDTIAEARERARSAGVDVCVVVNEATIVLGLLGAEQLELKDDVRASDAMRPGPSTFRPHVPIAEMAAYMQEHDLASAPITTSEGKLIGVLHRADAIHAAHEHP